MLVIYYLWMQCHAVASNIFYSSYGQNLNRMQQRNEVSGKEAELYDNLPNGRI